MIDALLAVTLLGCQDSTPFGSVSAAAVDNSGVSRAFVTGAAAAALDGEGRFVVTTSRSWKRRELAEEEARTLGQFYVRRFSRTNARFHEKLRGKEINFDRLTTCGRAFYANSPYEEPAEDIPVALVNVIAPRWIVTFCEEADEPVMSAAVATTATYLIVDGSQIDMSNLRGSEFYALGIPVGKTLMPSPERAVEHLARASGARVSEIPVLVLPGMPWEPLAARWHLTTDREVNVIDREGRPTRHFQLYVGRGNYTFDVRTFQGVGTRAEDSPERLIEKPGGEYYTFNRALDMPRRLVEVTIGGPR